MKTFAYTLLIVFCMFTSSLYGATYGGGSGTAEDPYQIKTAQHLNTIGMNPGDWDNCFKLMADINMSIYTGTKYSIIGNEIRPFTGIFDGNKYVIRNLTYKTTAKTDNVGLFGCTLDAAIQNLGVVDVSISSGGNNIAGLVGFNEGIITSCYVTGSIRGAEYVGGIAGDNRGDLIACYATSSVHGTYDSGGLTGTNDGTVTACYATGPVSGTEGIGGLAGSNNGMLTACYATGLVTGKARTGGLVGRQIVYKTVAAAEFWDYITACFWDKETTEQSVGIGDGTSAGITGKSTTQMQKRSTFADAGWDFTGETANGINDYWRMENNLYPQLAEHDCTMEGQGTADNPYIIKDVSDLSKIWLRPSDCYRLGGNLDLSGSSWSSAVVPVFTGSFDGQGFVISNLTIHADGDDNIGLFGYNNGGQIQNLNLQNVNITGVIAVGGLAGHNSGSITNCSVTGSVAGTGYYVGGLVGYNSSTVTACSATDSVHGEYSVGGLVGYHDYDSTLTACHAAGSVTGTGQVGGLVGYTNFESTLTSCYANGPVTGSISVGGLAGSNSAFIVSCCATGPVNGEYSVGGLAGHSSGTLTACYATGSVSGIDGVGGLAGDNSGNLTQCYAAGSVVGTYFVGGLMGYGYDSMPTSCFWDIEASQTNDGVGDANPDPSGVKGKTTLKMKTRSTFINAGWDFIDETENGTQDYWQMSADDYPRLVEGIILPSKATNPKPADDASNVRTNILLKWSAGLNTSSHDVYFGTDPSLDPNTSFRGNQTETTYNPGRLEVSTTYYWRIDERNTLGITTGKLWSFTVAGSSFTLQKSDISALKTPGLGTISVSGFFDAMDADVMAADEIIVTLAAEDLSEPNHCIWAFPINESTCKKGKFSCTNKGVSVSTLKIDTKTSKMTFTAKNVDLTGLSCPMTVTVTLGDYSESYELNEAIVNGKKPCPIPFMMGVKDTLTVDKYKVKHGKKPSTDSFTASGTFTIADDYDKASPLVITLGTQTFTVDGGQFANKNSIESCKKALSTEGPMVDAKFDFVKCTYTITVKNAIISQSGTVDFGINCFGVSLEGLETIVIN